MFGIFGTVRNPFADLAPGKYTGAYGQGLIVLISNIVKLAVVMAGLYSFINIILAGFQYLNAGGEPKNIAKAWEKIWQSFMGLVIVAGSFTLAMLIGWVVFGDIYALISPSIFAP
ncbi:MAG: hypothetical protein UX87_C0044G0007 [Candidatus Amesbacteria bacterium GW2011_GWA1_47_16]|uniref:Integral membrane protein n=5 Tax=Candidatus Amesiibacteriota TaxID=1752730 RepID=A0A1F4ZTM1_9BACT|nr:MAG: hypothetical protein UX87_C0044G0007 [Candidatus Amesbacteria bacterium GW2011_GWA1_47_16]KKU63145.1 MAG: hypothetical protein UX86_C0032G0008 [Candidatus Amesbacteria bacterium GW2011_GWC1_47_15]KKU97199.1 MAG: hypothetical protein UY28_C0026G0008 [Candidatus Amesbacteria bacterium GW2011_GWB1_48_13]OGC98859.1 MAG: hypothetical protein A2701_00765 [Candidatus Amesbacteria bacterium RIFCSPHIGHO2_01_FULL_47_34]OGD00651.1 MAG: hypothetical protein A2972_04260 [Candidatus Amesbacteria bact